MLVDTHSHLNFKAYNADREEVVKRTREAGVVCVDVGTMQATAKRAVELAQKYENIYAAIGLHPIHIKTDLMKSRLDEEESAFGLEEEFDAEFYRKLVENEKAEGPERSRRIVAIGEIGLDYYYRPKTKTRQELFKEKQRQVFIEQLNLAKELNLPVLLHCRAAHDDMIKILESHPINGVLHCFSGTAEEMQKYLALGFYIGFNGIIYKLPLDEAIKQCPLDKILLETDCPYLTPLPAVALAKAGPDGNVRNEPIFVKYVAERVAELKSITFDQVAEVTTQNARKLFGI